MLRILVPPPVHTWGSALCVDMFSHHDTVLDAHNHITWNYYYASAFAGSILAFDGCSPDLDCQSTLYYGPNPEDWGHLVIQTHNTGHTQINLFFVGGGSSGWVYDYWSCSGQTSEVCDGVDNNCDCDLPTDELDVDEDQYRICQGDCDDDDSEVNPGATEVCDGKDNDCDVYPAVPAGENDDDSDGFVVCDPWVGSDPSILGGNDCNDSSDQIYPTNPNTYCNCEGQYPQGTEESQTAGNCADGIDNDCDGLVDNCGGGCMTPAAASTLETNLVHGSSDLAMHLAYLLLPIGAVIGLGIWRRKK